MFRGIYNSLTGMGVQQARLDVISNNLANLNTSGYKGEQVISRTFGQVMLGHQGPLTRGINGVGPTNMGSVVSRVVTNLDQGQLVSTGNFTDLALVGDGYFMVQVGERELYSRDSALSVDGEGYLINSRGHRVLSDRGHVKVDSEEFTVNPDGTVLAQDQEYRLRLVEFADNSKLEKVGENYFAASEEAEEVTVTTQIQQGFVERSNVDVIKEITDMIAVMRSYEASQKIIQAQDEMLNKAVNQVGSLR